MSWELFIKKVPLRLCLGCRDMKAKKELIRIVKSPDGDVTLDFNEGRLVISVNKEESVDNSGKNYIHQERHRVSMSRSIYLADAAEERVKARLENGVLEIKVPKKVKESSAKRINIE